MIYHITSWNDWQDAQATRQYRAASLETEGFIHCSTRSQVLPVAQNFYKGQSGLLVLVIDPAQLSSDLKWEPPSGGTPPPGVPKGELFPHVYGPINPHAVIDVVKLEQDSQGKFKLASADTEA